MAVPLELALTDLWMLFLFHRNASSWVLAQGNSLSLKGSFLNLDTSEFPPVFSDPWCSSSSLDAVRNGGEIIISEKKIYRWFFQSFHWLTFLPFFPPSLPPFPPSFLPSVSFFLIHSLIPCILWPKIFLKIIIYLFIYACVEGLRCCAQASSRCGEQGLLFVVVCGLLIAVASLVTEHGL